MVHYVGIDWADQKHDVCVLAQDGRILSEFTIGNDWKGFEQLREVLHALESVKSILNAKMGYLSIGSSVKNGKFSSRHRRS